MAAQPSRKLIFYTTPPQPIPWPYIIVNANKPQQGLSAINSSRGVVESVIVDSGVEIFRDKRVKDYPGGPARWMRKLVTLYRRAKVLSCGADVYVTIPDYPDDYHPKSLWLSEKETNIERTVRNVEYALNHYPDIRWLIPVQGHYEKPCSVVRSLELLDKIGALEWAREQNLPLGLANLCVSKSCNTIRETARIACNWLAAHGYRLKVHIFGPSIKCMRNIAPCIHSFDSTAWTKPRVPGYSSAWNSVERIYLFITYIHKYADIIHLPSIPRSMRDRVSGTTDGG